MFGTQRFVDEQLDIRVGELLNSLPREDAPETVWNCVEAALSTPAMASRIAAVSRVRRLKTVIAIPTAAIAVAALAIYAVSRHASTKVGWQVVVLAGSPRIAGNSIKGTGQIKPGDWLETDAKSIARLKVGTIGTVTVQPGSQLRLVAARSEEQHLNLARGEMKADVKAPPRIFLVDTPSARAVDLGCLYTLTAEKDSSSMLKVLAGSVVFAWKGQETLVPAGATCRSDPAAGPGIPRYPDAPAILKTLLDSTRTGTSAARLLPVALANARPKDANSLWHLLRRTDGADRAAVCNRLAELIPGPPHEDRKLTLALDPLAMAQWQEEVRKEIFNREAQELFGEP